MNTKIRLAAASAKPIPFGEIGDPNMFEFFKSLIRPRLIRDFDERKPELYSWHESQLGYTYVSNKNRKILYRIVETNLGFYQVEALNGVPSVVGIYLDLNAAKEGAEKRWVDLNTWLS